jgi:GDP-L-fucose synthase
VGKLADAPSVTVWGSGTPRREFLFADDAADACVFAAEQYSGGNILNIGIDVDVSIGEFAHTVGDVVGFKGKLVFDRSRPDGTPRKLLDVSKMRQLGWEAKTSLRDGLYMAYADFVANGRRVVSKGPECLMVAR